MFRNILFYSILGLLSAVTACLAIQVDGHSFLINQTVHDSIMVEFYVDSTNSLAGLVYTDEQGYYLFDAAGEGIFDIFFSHQGYAGHGIHNRNITAPVTLEDVTLPELPIGILISDTLDTTLGAATYLVVGDILIQSGDSLIIEPGAVFIFAGRQKFDVYGYMYAVGTPTDSIWFMGASPTFPWTSIIFRNGADDNSEFSYCHVTGAGGSALNTYYTNLTISHCTFDNNAGNWGGGIYVSYCNPSIFDCIFTNNFAKNNGGGIYVTRSSPDITNCIVTGNSCSQLWGSGRGGGGITANHTSSPYIADCIVSNNISYRHGGGISVNDNSHPIITNCLITVNRADSTGGGIAIAGDCNSIISHCVIDSNSAAQGGGLCFGWNVNYTVDSCEIRANSADTSGGGIYVFDSSPSFSRCTVVYNTAPDTGGGIFARHTSLDLTHCTFSHNGAPLGGNAFFTADSLDTLFADTLINNIFAFSTDGQGICLDTSTNNIVISYCDIYGNAGGNFGGNLPDSLGVVEITNYNGDPCDYFYNIFLNPDFINPSNYEFYLLPGSPCVDAGDPTFPQDPDTTIADIGAHYWDHYNSINHKPQPVNPTEFRLYPNYPNPFNATTIIRYSLPQPERISLIIYNIMGRKVATLVDGLQDAGTHSVNWNSTNLASGVYIYRLQSDNRTLAQKMVLLK